MVHSGHSRQEVNYMNERTITLAQNLWIFDFTINPMKPFILLILLTIGLTFSSCEKSSTESEFLFEAEVIGRNNDCGIYAIRFTKYNQKANEIAGTLFTQYVFIAKNLPVDLQVDGLSIILNIRRINYSEMTACTTMGPSYPWIYVLSAKKKE